MTDRRSRHQIIRILPDKTSQSVNNTIVEILNNWTIKSITADNGTEFNRLAEVFPEDHLYYAPSLRLLGKRDQ